MYLLAAGASLQDGMFKSREEIVLQHWALFLCSLELLGCRPGSEISEKHTGRSSLECLCSIVDTVAGETEACSKEELPNHKSNFLWRGLLLALQT